MELKNDPAISQNHLLFFLDWQSPTTTTTQSKYHIFPPDPRALGFLSPGLTAGLRAAVTALTLQ